MNDFKYTTTYYLPELKYLVTEESGESYALNIEPGKTYTLKKGSRIDLYDEETTIEIGEINKMSNDNLLRLETDTTISELISFLQKLADGYGDLPVDTSLVFPFEIFKSQAVSASFGDDKIFLDFHHEE